jgi:hypothetical protein
MPRRIAFAILPLLVAIGCSRGPSLAPVSGKVTREGKPLANASVGFQPKNTAVNPGSGSYGRTDAAGNYELKVVTTDQPGAIVGPHKVLVTPETKSGKERDPKDDRAIYPKSVQFQFDVPPEGSTTANFDIPKETPAAPK